MSLSITPLGDEALLVDFGPKMHEAVNRRVLQLFGQLRKAAFPFVTDLVPAYSSLAVFYDSYTLLQHHNAPAYDQVALRVQQQLAQQEETVADQGRRWRIPVCYEPKFGPDLRTLATEKSIPVEEVIRLHTSTAYRVYMIGFLPGFAYLGKVDDRLATPRHSSPREKVEAGSVGIAGHQTGIYPLDSPGGWQIIGRTPIAVFDRKASVPALLAPNDEITFYSITEHEFESYPGRRS